MRQLRLVMLIVVVSCAAAVSAAAAQEPTASPTTAVTPQLAEPAATQTATPGKPAEPSPQSSEGELCRNPDPGRALKQALDAENNIIAIAVPLGEFDVQSGIRLRIVHVFDEPFPAGEVVADADQLFTCLRETIWSPSVPVLGKFLVFPETGQIATTAGWPIRSPNGQSFDAPAFAAGEVAAEELLVELDGVTVTVAELLQRGRDYVEPSPTPLPPGVSPATVVPVDVGAPDAGGGPGTASSRHRDLIAALAVLGGGLALAFGAARVVYRRR